MQGASLPSVLQNALGVPARSNLENGDPFIIYRRLWLIVGLWRQRRSSISWEIARQFCILTWVQPNGVSSLKVHWWHSSVDFCIFYVCAHENFLSHPIVFEVSDEMYNHESSTTIMIMSLVECNFITGVLNLGIFYECIIYMKKRSFEIFKIQLFIISYLPIRFYKIF